MKINQNLFQFSNGFGGFAIISAYDYYGAETLLNQSLKKTVISDWIIDQKIGISFINNFCKISEDGH